MARDRPAPYDRRVPPPVVQECLILTRLRSGDRKLQRGSARACPSPCCVNRKIARDRPSCYEPKTIAGDRPPRYGIRNGSFYRRARACPSPCSGARERSRGTGPRATFISFSSPHRTSSASDSPQKQDPATAASLMSPAYHQTPLPQSDSNTQYPASQTYR